MVNCPFKSAQTLLVSVRFLIGVIRFQAAFRDVYILLSVICRGTFDNSTASQCKKLYLVRIMTLRNAYRIANSKTGHRKLNHVWIIPL